MKEWFGIIGGNALAFVSALLATITANDYNLWLTSAIGIVIAIISGISTTRKNKALRLEAEAKARAESEIEQAEAYRKEIARIAAIKEFHGLCCWCNLQDSPVENCGNPYPPQWCKNKKEKE